MDQNSERRTSNEAVWKRLIQVAIVLSAGALAFVGKASLGRLDRLEERNFELERTHERMTAQFEEIRRDDTKWAALARMEEQVTKLRIQAEVMIRLWDVRQGIEMADARSRLTDEIFARVRAEGFSVAPVPAIPPDVYQRIEEQKAAPSPNQYPGEWKK